MTEAAKKVYLFQCLQDLGKCYFHFLNWGYTEIVAK